MEIFEQIRILDLLDIILVSTLIYVIYCIFSRTRAARMMIGLALVGIVYIVARLLELRLTSEILQAFFAVIIIALIIIFQDEIRKLFERIGNRKWFGNLDNSNNDIHSFTDKRIQVLVDTVTDLSKQRIGALIVIKGIDEITPMISGGIVLNGQLSESILKSVFDPHSQGHDGAVIIAGDNILLFACHLPLSTNTSKILDFGTRHAAGLGITEHVDAFCIIVSEERGTVSVARNGNLTVLKNPALLSNELKEFYELTERKITVGWISGTITGDVVPKLVSICLAIILWIFFILLPSLK